MMMERRGSGGTTLIPLETRLLASRKVFIEGEINAHAACEFMRQVMLLSAESAEKPIDVLINSPGGEVAAGMMMYDLIQTCPAPIRTYCVGSAYSMAAVIFACGRHGRYMLENSRLMIHEPLLGSPVQGNASSIRAISERLLEERRSLCRILARHSGRTEEEIEREIACDRYFTAQESIDFGLCDGVVGFDAMMKEGL